MFNSDRLKVGRRKHNGSVGAVGLGFSIVCMITIEVRNVEKAGQGEAEVEIFCDQDGLALLFRQLGFLKQAPAHVHLMTPSWAGNELNETRLGEGTAIINHLKVTSLPADQ